MNRSFMASSVFPVYREAVLFASLNLNGKQQIGRRFTIISFAILLTVI
jgi:hypothetical protein